MTTASDRYEDDIEFPQAVCVDDKTHAAHLIAGTWRERCPGVQTEEPEGGITSVIAEDAPIGVLLWPVSSPEAAPKFTLSSVTRTKASVIWWYESGDARHFEIGERVAVKLAQPIFARGDVVQIQDRDRHPQNYSMATVVAAQYRGDEFGYLIRYDNDCVVWRRDWDVLAPRS